MAAAAAAEPSGMVAVVGLPLEQVEELCREAQQQTNQHIAVANLLCKGNYVASGGSAACSALESLGKSKYKARATVRLPVAGGFHSSFMLPARERLGQLLEEVPLQVARIPVISNVDAMPHTDPKVIRRLLLKQLTSPVLFEASLQKVLDSGYEEGWEVGPGAVISGLMRRMDKTKKVRAVE
eukprot:GHVT01097051.1.p2 GENE.GHVT01097051.1~~GHVT01097051.1.p2  ORF type:complete len:182 (+),score=47.43 GHVT01097051.1:513-1058(+)